MDDVIEDLKKKVEDQSGALVNVSELFVANQVVGLYFSAHWCPPCRAFTPVLSKLYTKLNERQSKALEIIFISRDRNEKQFQDYFKTMPWTALSFKESETSSFLMDKYQLTGIPTLILLNESGKIISTKGRDMVMKDPNGDNFPCHQ